MFKIAISTLEKKFRLFSENLVLCKKVEKLSVNLISNKLTIVLTVKNTLDLKKIFI